MRKGISLVTGLFRRAWFVERFNARRGKKAETSAVVTARFPRLIRDKARTNWPLNAFARFARVNAVLPRFVSEYQTFRAFTRRLIFRCFFAVIRTLLPPRLRSRVPRLRDHFLSRDGQCHYPKWLENSAMLFTFSVRRDFKFQLFYTLGARFIRKRNFYRFVVSLNIENTYKN